MSETNAEYCGDYNSEILDTIKPKVKTITAVCIVIGVFVDLLCFKYRKLANILVTFEAF